jgi:threonine dehydratase
VSEPAGPGVTAEDVRRAASRIAGAVVRTPCLVSQTLSEIAGVEVVLKFENLQFTASFKERGALNKLLLLGPDARARGVIAMSAGNHAQAVARHAGRLGIRATLVMPRYTPNVKVEQTRRFGAEVVLHGDELAQAAAHAETLARECGLAFVHPYDDPAVIAGQGTVALEMLEDHPDLAALLVPVGGGGLAAGCALAAHALSPALEVYGVEAARFPSMRQALAGEPIACGRDSVAEGIAVKQPGVLTRSVLARHARDILLVAEDDLEAAVLLLLEVEKTVAEGAGAAALAALLRERARFAGRKVGVVVSGGNIDPLLLASILLRGLARSGRLVRLRVVLPDRPGALADVTRLLADADANVVEVSHQRAFGGVPLREAEVELVLATRGREHVTELRRALDAHGYRVTLPDAELPPRP